jgi:hypothetical protein
MRLCAIGRALVAMASIGDQEGGDAPGGESRWKIAQRRENRRE